MYLFSIHFYAYLLEEENFIFLAVLVISTVPQQVSVHVFKWKTMEVSFLKK